MAAVKSIWEDIRNNFRELLGRKMPNILYSLPLTIQFYFFTKELSKLRKMYERQIYHILWLPYSVRTVKGNHCDQCGVRGLEYLVLCCN